MNDCFKLNKLLLLISITAISLVTIGLYYNSLNVPFYLDDIGSITSNPNFTENTTYLSLFHAYGMRFVGYVSLWWDFEAAGLNVTRYHQVNITIHMLASIAVFFFTVLIQIAASRKLGVAQCGKKIILISLVVGLLFAVHPLQTQAVTYIVQRLAALTALFYILTLTFYLGFRLSSLVWQKAILLGLVFLFACLAIFTKQNAVTLPFAIVLLELIFFNTVRRKHIVNAALIGLVSLFLVYIVAPEWLVKIDALTRENKEMTRWEYFTTQLPILWVYISKFFFPYPLHLEYSYTVEYFTNFQKVIAGICHIGVIALAIAFYKRIPILCFGVLFFYLAHSIESGFIPITDLAFEHRNYLPLVGLVLALVACIEPLTRQSTILVKSTAAIVSVIVFIALGTQTVLRNEQWQDPMVFFTHELQHNPTNQRTLHDMVNLMTNNGQYDEAIGYLERLYEVSNGEVHSMVSVTHLSILINQNKAEEAIKLGESLLLASLHPHVRSLILSNLAIVYVNQNRYEQAKSYFQEAVEYWKLPVNSLVAYAYTLYQLNELTEAERILVSVLNVQPQEPTANKLIQVIRDSSQRAN
jgi:Tfp pilus assembly protein PilF